MFQLQREDFMKKVMIGAALACAALTLSYASAQPFSPSGFGMPQSTATSPLQGPYQETSSVSCNSSNSTCTLSFAAVKAETLVTNASCEFLTSGSNAAFGVGAKGNILNYFTGEFGTGGIGYITNQAMYLFYAKGSTPEVISTGGTGISKISCTISGYHS